MAQGAKASAWDVRETQASRFRRLAIADVRVRPASTCRGGQRRQPLSGLGSATDKGGAATAPSETRRAAETLNPATRQTSRSAAGNLHGVPLGYRDQAEAYFKRLAKEQ